MKKKSIAVNVNVGTLMIVGIMHIVTIDDNAECGLKVVDVFEDIRKEGYQPMCPNGLKSIKDHKIVKKLLIPKQKNKAVDYIISFKYDLNQVSVLYDKKNKLTPIGIVTQDEDVLKGYRIEPGGKIAIFSGEKVA
jgi:hypothetical protein